MVGVLVDACVDTAVEVYALSNNLVTKNAVQKAVDAQACA